MGVGSFCKWAQLLVVPDLGYHGGCVPSRPFTGQRSSSAPFCLWRRGFQAEGRASQPQTPRGLASLSPSKLASLLDRK